MIELQERGGIYVPNNILMGNDSYKDKKLPTSIMENGQNDVNGVLLYGINSSGKSSLMKSIGCATLMAQSGFFVSATSFRFSIFDSLFTRIVSKDNLAKGLSTFAVEMLELKNIFNRATSKSLILGDEISHSTETSSGVSIVASAILKLSKLQSIFIFATHLHQLPELEEIEKLKKILIELTDYERDVLYPLATKKIEIDLDDGVKHNYPLFGKALKKIAGIS